MQSVQQSVVGSACFEYKHNHLPRQSKTQSPLWVGFLVLFFGHIKGVAFQNHLLAKHTTRLTPPSSPSKTLIYLLKIKHVSTSLVVMRTSKVLALSGANFAEPGPQCEQLHWRCSQQNV